MQQVQWRRPDRQVFSGGYLTFDRQVDCMTTGNYAHAVQCAVRGAVGCTVRRSSLRSIARPPAVYLALPRGS
jgi:hypothetical protein